VATSADLSLTKTDAPDPVGVGNNLTYTLTAANAGPSDAQAVVVTDTLPANVTSMVFGSAVAGAGSSPPHPPSMSSAVASEMPAAVVL